VQQPLLQAARNTEPVSCLLVVMRGQSTVYGFNLLYGRVSVGFPMMERQTAALAASFPRPPPSARLLQSTPKHSSSFISTLEFHFAP
jgi:hypothetical protein